MLILLCQPFGILFFDILNHIIMHNKLQAIQYIFYNYVETCNGIKVEAKNELNIFHENTA